MASLLVYSQFQYGDKQSMEAFFVEHALRHTQYGTLISSKYKQTTPLFDLFDNKMVVELEQMMAKPAEQRATPFSFADWAFQHAQLHQFEVQALLVGEDFNLQDPDFTNELSMQDWLTYHASIHDYEDTVLGV